MGRIGWSGLCIFTSPLMEGAEGFKLTYFHLLSRGISVLLSFIVFLICLECFGWVGGGLLEVVFK